VMRYFLNVYRPSLVYSNRRFYTAWTHCGPSVYEQKMADKSIVMPEIT
jgi:hypothetical protein